MLIFGKEQDENDHNYNLEYDGCNYATLVDLLQCGVLKHCGCGLPEENIEFVMNGLKIIDSLKEKTTYLEWESKSLEFFHNDEIRYFFYYVVDQLKLTEHGTQVPGGWLTEKGKEFIRLAEVALKDFNNKKQEEDEKIYGQDV